MSQWIEILDFVNGNKRKKLINLSLVTAISRPFDTEVLIFFAHDDDHITILGDSDYLDEMWEQLEILLGIKNDDILGGSNPDG